MKKYIILAGCTLMMLCLGGVYGWSLFIPELIETYQYDNAQMQCIYGVTILVLTFSMILFASRLERKFGPKTTAIIGGILVGIGYFTASMAKGNFWLLLVGYSVINGTGIGLGYLSALSCSIRWFPQNKGLVSGFVMGGYGAGAILISFTGYELLKSGVDVMKILLLISPVYGSIIILCGFLLSNPKTYKPAISDKIPIKKILTEKRFWKAFIGLGTGTFPGLMLIGSLKPICLSFGFSLKTAALAITVVSAGNAVGRIKWGGIYDKLGKKTITILLLFVIFSTLLFFTEGLASIYFILAMALITGICYGGCLSVFAAYTADEYGNNFGVVFPIVLASHGICAPFSSIIAGAIYDNFNSYKPAIFIASAVAVIGLAAVYKLNIFKPNSKLQN